LAHLDLHSFPTRRSSDLFTSMEAVEFTGDCVALSTCIWNTSCWPAEILSAAPSGMVMPGELTPEANSIFQWKTSNSTLLAHSARSEEHTSELQSLAYLVC